MAIPSQVVKISLVDLPKTNSHKRDGTKFPIWNFLLNYKRSRTELARDRIRQEQYRQRRAANTHQPATVHTKPVQTNTVCKQTNSSESKQSTPPRPASADQAIPSKKNEDRHEDSGVKDTACGITEPASVSHRRDSVHVKRTFSTRKDSLRSSKQCAKVRFTGKPCYLVKSFRNDKLVLTFCSKCTDNYLGVLKGLKTDKGGGMQLNTNHGTNFVWTCSNCREDDQCSALEIQS